MKYLAGLRVREDQFARLRQLCPADHEFPKDWAAWSALVATANELAVTEQLDAKPLDLDIEHFEQWCRLVGIVPCKAVVFALARMALRLNPAHAGRYFNPKTRKATAVRKDLPPRVMESLGLQLGEAFAGAAGQLWAIEQARLPAPEQERKDLAAGLLALVPGPSGAR